MKTKQILEALSLILFLTAGVMAYAYVYDVEYVSEEKRYEMDRDSYNRSHDAGYADFMSFPEWVSEQNGREQRMHDWISRIEYEIAVGAALSFDPWYVQDTNQGHAGAAPENWASGRD